MVRFHPMNTAVICVVDHSEFGVYVYSYKVTMQTNWAILFFIPHFLSGKECLWWWQPRFVPQLLCVFRLLLIIEMNQTTWGELFRSYGIRLGWLRTARRRYGETIPIWHTLEVRPYIAPEWFATIFFSGRVSFIREYPSKKNISPETLQTWGRLSIGASLSAKQGWLLKVTV